MGSGDGTAASAASYRWSRKSLAELVGMYHEVIEPTLQREGHPPGERPSYQTLADCGFSGLSYALREHHGLTVREFLVEEVGLNGAGDDGDTWGIENERARAELTAYCETLRDRRGLAPSTVRSKRSRLRRYARAYAATHGEASFVEHVGDRDVQAAEIERQLAVFDRLDRDVPADTTKLRLLGAVDQFYRHLERRRKAAYNPVGELEREYDWTRSAPDNRPLGAEQVAALVEAVESPSDELLLYATCAWGLRRSEVATLHVSQLQLGGDDPTIHFEERKNGPSTVSLLYGREVAADRVTALGDRPDWSGYLFPSPQGAAPHVSGDTVYRWFRKLAERAGVTVDGNCPTPQHGRRFWYEAYSEALEELVEMLEPAAEEQGSSDPTVVARNYISEDRRREFRRERMRTRLERAFGTVGDGDRATPR